MDTAPLPVVPGREPDRPSERGWPMRLLEGLAGLVSGGLVLIGAGLVLAQLLAPTIAPGAGLTAPSGPGWGRALAQLLVGAAGEALYWARPRLNRPVRVWGALAVVIAAAVVLWWCWWR